MKRLMVLFLFLGYSFSAYGVEWETTLGGDTRWFDWREHESGKQVLMEYGQLLGVVGDITLKDGDMIGRLGTGLSGGLTQYNGHLQNPLGGLGAKYKSRAFEAIMETKAQIGWKISEQEIRAGYLRRDWHRYISGSSGVSSAEELYSWQLATIGASIILPLGSIKKLPLSFDAGFPLRSDQRVYSVHYGDFDLTPGDGKYFRISTLFSYNEWQFIPYFQYHDMTESNRVLRTTSSGASYYLYQPASLMRELGLTVRRSWKSKE